MLFFVVDSRNILPMRCCYNRTETNLRCQVRNHILNFWLIFAVIPFFLYWAIIHWNCQHTRWSNFWSSKVCEGGSHVKHMHADSLLIYCSKIPPSLVRAGSKVNFRSVWKRIKSGLSNKVSHVIIYFEEKLGCIKSESPCICFTWLPPSHTLLDQKLDPRVIWFES